MSEPNNFLQREDERFVQGVWTSMYAENRVVSNVVQQLLMRVMALESLIRLNYHILPEKFKNEVERELYNRKITG